MGWRKIKYGVKRIKYGVEEDYGWDVHTVSILYPYYIYTISILLISDLVSAGFSGGVVAVDC